MQPRQDVVELRRGLWGRFVVGSAFKIGGWCRESFIHLFTRFIELRHVSVTVRYWHGIALGLQPTPQSMEKHLQPFIGGARGSHKGPPSAKFWVKFFFLGGWVAEPKDLPPLL